MRPSSTPHPSARLLTRALGALALTAVVACGGRGEREGDRKRPPPPVTVVDVLTVATGDVADLLLASAVVEAEASADITPAATGMVVSVLRDVGDDVRRGDVLAILDNVTLDAGAERARAEVAHLQSQLAEVTRLYESKAVSEREVADLRFQLDNARTRLREASRTAGETRLTAPFDGVVAARDVKVGEMAGSARRAFQVVDLSELRVRARLPERDVGRVAEGQRARLVGAYDASQAATARVTRISPVIDSSSGTFEVTLTVDPGQEALRPGQFVSVELEVDRHRGVIVAPKDAVRYDAGRPVAFVMVDAPPDETEAQVPAEEGEPAPEPARHVARRVELELGLTDAVTAEVMSGLTVGDQLIVVGQANLRDGARVRVPDLQVDAAARREASARDDEG